MPSAPETADSAPPRDASGRPPKARRVLLALAAIAAIAAAGRYVHGRGREVTDDAQVEGRIISVSPRIPGQVARVLVADNQLVEQGDVLVELDTSDLSAKLEAAQADRAAQKAQLLFAEAQLALTDKTAAATLAQARAGITQAASGITSSESSVRQAEAERAAAKARFQLAELEYARIKELADQGAVPKAQLDGAQTQYDSASAALDQADARLAAARAGTSASGGGLALAQGRLLAAQAGPEQVQAARAAVELAKARVMQSEASVKLAEQSLSFATLRAPRKGAVSRRTVEVGQMVGPERPLLAIVPLDDVWIVANFKEDQIGAMRKGQAATVTVDAFSGKKFLAHVDSIAGASGARFSLLPPDNATGNFIKVVQRIPVLVRLEANATTEAELRPGMSAEVTVVTR